MTNKDLWTFNSHVAAQFELTAHPFLLPKLSSIITKTTVLFFEFRTDPTARNKSSKIKYHRLTHGGIPVPQ